MNLACVQYLELIFDGGFCPRATTHCGETENKLLPSTEISKDINFVALN
jgi:hypothetical protein